MQNWKARAVAMVAGVACLAGMALPAGAAPAAPRFVYSPYQFLPLAGLARAGGPDALTLAFATGECGDEKWGERTGDAIAASHVPAFVKAGSDYIISTGGGGAKFTCATDAGMERFIARYESPRLLGIDFDIEDGQSLEQVDALVQRIAAAQKAHPRLRMSFTVATHAADDGSLRSLNALGETILAAVRRHGVRDAVFNLMVMDYGDAAPNVCVAVDGRCDMARSALQAARNVHAKYALPYAQIELTPMIGINDVASNVFSVGDARALAQGVKTLKLAGLHFWSLDRDTPCATPTAAASPTCSAVDAPAGAFTQAMRAVLP